MHVILKVMDMMEISLRNEGNRKHVMTIMTLPNQIERNHLPSEVSSAIKSLWSNQNVLECFNRSREYQLNDFAKYYFDSIDHISKPDYIRMYYVPV